MKTKSSLVVVVALKATVFLFPIWTTSTETVRSKETALFRKARETLRELTTVVNHAFCDSNVSDENKMAKRTLKEIHTYAERLGDIYPCDIYPWRHLPMTHGTFTHRDETFTHR